MKFLVASLYLQAALKSASWPEAHDSYYMPSHINGESQFDFASASAAYPFTVACVREGLLASHPCWSQAQMPQMGRFRFAVIPV